MVSARKENGSNGSLRNSELLLPAQQFQAERHAIGRVLSGDEEGFSDIYFMHRQRLFSHCLRITVNPEYADSVAHDAFAKGWDALRRGLYEPQGDKPFLAYLFTIANNLIVDDLRKRKHLATTNFPKPKRKRYVFSQEDEIVEGLDLELRMSMLEKYIDKLPPNYRSVIRLRYIENLPYPEVAALMQKREGAVRVMVMRAIQELRKLTRGDPRFVDKDQVTAVRKSEKDKVQSSSRESEVLVKRKLIKRRQKIAGGLTLKAVLFERKTNSK